VQARNPQGFKESLFAPKAEIPVYGACRPELFRKRLPLYTGTQDIKDFFKYFPGG
jgi:hypothetical protein